MRDLSPYLLQGLFQALEGCELVEFANIKLLLCLEKTGRQLAILLAQ